MSIFQITLSITVSTKNTYFLPEPYFNILSKTFKWLTFYLDKEKKENNMP